MADKPVHLKVAAPAYQQEIINELDHMRQHAVNGDLQSLVIIPIFNGGDFTVTCRGNINAIEMSGYLGRAWLDAMEAMKRP